ncbi:MAG: SRPBCC family protein [Nevskia sp.]|jgi:hypothetical protein|nr:SRPBCC family protein [Nevskia sp.]MCK9386591.1 SRPBCC family protein [Nevskia sp.]
MAVIEHAIEIAAPIDRVFAVSQDYAVRYNWDPFPRSLTLLDNSGEVGIGSRTRVVGKSGLAMTVAFVQWRPPFVAAIVMTEGPWLFQRFAGSWTFRIAAENRTWVKFRYVVKLRHWALPWLSEPIAALWFGWDVKARLRGLKHYCEKDFAKT